MSQTKLEKLFEPGKIGGLELANRIVMLAVTTRYDYDSIQRLVDFYAARAAGGAGLITIGALQTLFPGRRTGTGKLNLYNDADVTPLAELVKAIHAQGGKAAAQLATYGYWSKKGLEGTAEDVGPSTVTLPRENVHPLFSLAEYLPRERALEAEEIGLIQEAVGQAALRAKEAGFDALELQCIGGNILHRFTNPFTNTRGDQYGGSLENRTRMITETMARIKAKVGPDFPLICRIAGFDPVPWGLGLEDWQKMAALIERAGGHALNIYPKWFESREPLPQMSVPRNVFVHLAEGIKKAVDIPVITAVRISDPLDAEGILARGQADFVGMARPLVADPDLPAKAEAGRLEDVRLCTACCRCYDDVAAEKFMSCAVNAQAGKEARSVIRKAPRAKKVLVIGGGPAGMEAARVAALRGHRVTLLEAGDRLGGQLNLAAVLPHKDEWNSLIRYLATQLEKLKVEVRLNQRGTPREIEAERPEVLIAAAGAVPARPDIPGLGGRNVVTALDILSGRQRAGEKVVVVGGGPTGCETAEYLTQKGSRVTILEMLGRMGHEYGPMNRYVVIDRLVAAGIRLETGVKVVGVTEKGVRVVRAGLYPEFFEADTVVLALGMTPQTQGLEKLSGLAPAVFTIGDQAAPASVGEAIESGFRTALQI